MTRRKDHRSKHSWLPAALLAPAIWLLPAVGLDAQSPDRLVAVTRPTQIYVEGQAAAGVDPGTVLRVIDSKDEWLGVDVQPPGWIRRENAVPLEQATAYFDKVLRDNPNDSRAYIARAKVRSSVGQLGFYKAIEDLTAEIELNSQHEESYVKRGELWFKLGQYDRAFSDYSVAIRLNPKNADAYLMRGNIWLKKGEYQRAIEDYTQLIHLRPWRAESYSPRAYAFYVNRNYVQALVDYDRVIELDPLQADAHYMQGRIYAEHRRLTKAVSRLGEALRLNPRHAEAYFYRGLVQLQRDRPEEAQEDFDQAIRFDPQLADAYDNRGNIHFKRGEYDSALADFSKVIQLDAGRAGAYNKRGMIYLARRKIDQAVADFTQAIRFDPELVSGDARRHAWAFAVQAEEHLGKGEFDAAIVAAREAVRLAPEASTYVGLLARGLNLRANRWLNNGEIDRAKDDIREAIKTLPLYAPAINTRAYAAYLAGNYEEAVADYKEAIRIDPQHVPAYANYAWLMATCPDEKYRNGKKAVEFAAFACRLTDWKALEIIDTLAAAHAEAGNVEDAVKWQSRVVAHAPEAQRESFVERLELYRDKKAYRENPRKNDALLELVAAGEAMEEKLIDLTTGEEPADSTPAGSDQPASTSESVASADKPFDLTSAELFQTPEVEPDDEKAVAALEKLGAETGKDAHGNVRAIGLQFSKLRDKDVVHMKGFPLLEVLNLTFTLVGDEGLKQLKDVSTLKVLVLDETRITDAGLAHLAKLKNLEMLSIKATEISDAGLEHLTGLTNLKILLLQNTRVRSPGIEKLQEALPDLKIVR